MLRKFSLFVFVAMLLAIALSPHKVSAQDTSNFTITSFQGDYYLTKDQANVSHMRVVERIDALFPNYDQNHGIERALPKSYKNQDINLHIESVTNDSNQSIHYTTRDSNGNEVLRIGDANSYVRGPQTYVISYSIDYPISFYPDHDALYWNANGVGWQQPFNKVVARLHIDPSIPSSAILPQLACYTGFTGSHDSHCTIEKTTDSNGTVIVSETTTPLNPTENLTFVVGFAAGTFAHPPTDWKAILWTLLIIVGTIAPPLIAIIYMSIKWYRSGRDAKGKGVIIPQYQPLKGVTPLVSDLILNENMRPVAISATVLDLCVGKYLNIYETSVKKMIGSKTEYELAVMKDTSALPADVKKVMSMLFSSHPAVGERINITTLKNKLYKDVPSLTTLVEQTGVTQGYFAQNPSTIRKKYTTIGSVLLGIGFLSAFIHSLFFLASFALTGFIIMLFSRIMPARTTKGVEAKDYLLGMKDYMKLAEADRIKTLQSPQGAEKLSIDPNDPAQLVKLYEKLLPYALLFGIEKEWIEQFSDLYKTPPDWYHGSQAFNSALFVSSISSLNSAAMSSFSAPSSSGSSGFGGGGFSGGGGGGGGGGGW